MPDKKNKLTIQASSGGLEKTLQPSDCVRPPAGPKSDYFPNVTVVTHENRKALFYDDLLRGKTVLINFMSIKDDEVYRLTENLAKVQAYLGDRLGRDVYMYSITVDPVRDTPAALELFAEKHGAGPGWLFLTGHPQAIQAVRDRLFAGGGHDHEGGHAQDCSMGVLRYGNEAVGLWGSVPSKTNPEWIAQRVKWVESKEAPPQGQFRRGGPPPLAKANSPVRKAVL